MSAVCVFLHTVTLSHLRTSAAEQHANITFCFAKRISCRDIAIVYKTLWVGCNEKMQVCCWHKRFSDGRVNVNDENANLDKWLKHRECAHCCAKWPTKEYSGDAQWDGSNQKNGCETAGSFCTKTHLDTCPWFKKKNPSRSTVGQLWNIRRMSRTCHHLTFPCFRD